MKRRIYPSREEIGAVYQLLRKNHGFSGDVELLYLKIRKSGLNYCKFRFVLDILEELNLIQPAPLGQGISLRSRHKGLIWKPQLFYISLRQFEQDRNLDYKGHGML